MAEEGCALPRRLKQAATNQEEAARFVTDSQALVFVAQAWREKVLAAIAKRGYQKTGEEKYAQSLRDHLRQSIEIYEKLVDLTDKTYINATDMLMGLNWHEGLKAFKKDQEDSEEVSRLSDNALQAGHARTNRRLAERSAGEALQVVEAGRSRSRTSAKSRSTPKSRRTWEMPGFTVKEMTIQSTPGRRIEIVLTIPERRQRAACRPWCASADMVPPSSPPYTNGKAFGPLPADTSDGSPLYKGFAAELAKSGYVTISTLVSQHEVYEKGRTLMGERLWDLMRCVSYLESLPKVDKLRIGCGGLSLGGEMTMWLAAMDTAHRGRRQSTAS